MRLFKRIPHLLIIVVPLLGCNVEDFSPEQQNHQTNTGSTGIEEPSVPDTRMKFDTSGYDDMRIKMVPLGKELIFNMSLGDKVGKASFQAQPKGHKIYNFELVVTRGWDNSIKKYGIDDSAIYLLFSSNGRENVDYESLAARGCISEPPMYMHLEDGVNENRMYYINNNCSDSDLSGARIEVHESSGFSTKEVFINISRSGNSYRSLVVMDKYGINKIIEWDSESKKSYQANLMKVVNSVKTSTHGSD